MNCKFFLFTSVCVVSFFSLKAQSLKLGDDAPALHIIKWLKGKPVSSFEKGKVYLIDFSLVSCSPCRALMPHLTELSTKYKERKLEVITIFSDGNPKKPSDLTYIKNIQGLVTSMGRKLDHAIAVDVPEQKTRELWGDVNSFPTVYIVNQDGKIAYNSSGSPQEIEFALEAIFNTGKYDPNSFHTRKEIQEEAETDKRWHQFTYETQQNLKEKGDYKKMITNLDSVLVNAPDDKREELLFDKFKVYLYQNDSVAADRCLRDITVNKKDNWEALHHEKFLGFLPPYVNRRLPFNYDRYLEIADRTIIELGVPTVQVGHLIIKSKVMYAYKNNLNAALTELNKALKLSVQSGSIEIIRFAESEIKQLKQIDSDRKQADGNWRELLSTISKPTPNEYHETLTKRGNAAAQQLMAEYKKKQASLANTFRKKYPMDERIFDVALILLRANSDVLVPWIGDLSTDYEAELNKNEEKLQKGYFNNRDRNLYYGRAYFRSFPLDLDAQAEWVIAGDEMVRDLVSYKPGTSAQEKELLDWEVFGRDWREAAFTWRNMPRVDERPEDDITRLEASFWKKAGVQYWEFFWRRLNDHINKYQDLPIIADRAADFLSGTQRHDPDLVISYWQRLIDKYSDSNHPLRNKEAIIALVNRAKEQLRALKVEQQLIPLDMKFTAMDGRKIDLADYKGKIVLIDFWASWCKPCVGEMPAMKAVYDKYHDKGFEMIGICLDDESKRDEVKRLLEKNSVIGPQRFEGKGFDGDLFKQLYGIFALPTVWLLDRNGMLVSNNARGEELERLLNKYFSSGK